MKFRFIALLIPAFIFCSPINAATFYGENPGAGIHEEQFNNGWIYVYLPTGYDPNKRYPLIVFSMMSEAGNMDIHPDDFARPWIKQADKNNYIVATFFVNGTMEMIDPWYLKAINKVKNQYAVDKSRVLITGFGEGANYAIHLGVSYPKEFTGVVPVAGIVEGAWKPYMKFKTQARPEFFFLAGANDDLFPPAAIEKSAEGLKKRGYIVKFETLEKTGHEYAIEFTEKTSEWFESLPDKGF